MMTLREIIYDLCKDAVRNSDYVAQSKWAQIFERGLLHYHVVTQRNNFYSKYKTAALTCS
jgi:hypothetical protein